MPSSNKRFLERFWSLYLVGRLGAGHTIGHALLGFLRLMGIAILAFTTIAILLWLLPDLAAVFLSLIVMLALLGMVLKIAWYLVTWFFR